MHSREIEALTLLLQADPDAAKKKNGSGKLPLHLLCEIGDSLQAVKLVMEAYEDALWQPDAGGSLPCHLAVASGAADSHTALLILQVVHDTWPAAALQANGEGHRAVDLAGAPVLIKIDL